SLAEGTARKGKPIPFVEKIRSLSTAKLVIVDRNSRDKPCDAMCVNALSMDTCLNGELRFTHLHPIIFFVMTETM
ncbi:hypothetical protein Ocin01_00973, partial [Orchesella cincta]